MERDRPQQHEDQGAAERTRADDEPLADALEAFNAGEVVEEPGHPPRAEASPTIDADVDAPG